MMIINVLPPAVAPISGPPLVTLATDVASACVALDVLAILGTILLLVASDMRRPSSRFRQLWWTVTARRARGAVLDGVTSAL
jgi:hypothetical protein